jgi:spore coat protein A
VPPIWNPEFFGNCIVVNGRTWPFLGVAPRRYRFRLLNACQARTLILGFDDPKVDIWQIGSDGGYLPAVARLDQVRMGPAERVDVIVDLSRVALGTSVMLQNRGPDEPLGEPGFTPADPASTGLVMQLRVNQSLPHGFIDPSTPPDQMVMPSIPPRVAQATRSLALVELELDGKPDTPTAVRLGTFDPSVGAPAGIRLLRWHDAETENPGPGDVEMWQLYNFTGDAHPIHIHEVLFEVVNHQRIDTKTGRLIGAPQQPQPGDEGYQDTVLVLPGEVTRIRMWFPEAGQFVWH